MGWPVVTIDTTAMDEATDDASQARTAIKQMADNVNLMKDSRGAANGVGSRDAAGKSPLSELPTIPPSQGGTGQTGYSVGDILYAGAAGILTKLPAATAGYVLTSNGVGAAPSWQQSGGGLSTGTRMSFNQTAAPTGWTKDITAAMNDSIMRIVTGNVGSGGSTAFSTFNGQASVGATTLSTAQLPTLTYQGYGRSGSSSSQGPRPDLGFTYPTGAYNTVGWFNIKNSASDGGFRDANGGGAHSHTMTTAIKYNDFIIAQKD